MKSFILCSVFDCLLIFLSSHTTEEEGKEKKKGMPIISAGVVDKNGRVLIARQFLDISRARIEGLFHAFPRLRDANVKKQATFLDAGSVRYVYQPMESQLFLVLITTLNSNVIEDLSTLRMMSSVISDTLTGLRVRPEEIEMKGFRILFAFDEIVVGGKTECSSLEEVNTYLLMDSAEETIYLEHKQKLMEAAKKTTIEQARILKEKKMMGMARSSYDPYGGFGSDRSASEDGGGSERTYSGLGRFGSMGMDDGSSRSSATEYYTSAGSGVGSSSFSGSALGGANGGAYSQSSSSKPIAGMALGKKGMGLGSGGLAHGPLGGVGKGNEPGAAGGSGSTILSKVQREIGMGPSRSAGTATPGAASSGVDGSAGAGAGSGPVHVSVKVEEKIMVTQTRDGDVTSAEVKGELSLVIQDARCERIMLELQVPEDGVFAFKPHPKLNKELFAARGVLAMLDTSKSFPVQQSIMILQWKASPGVKVTPPLLFTCWPELGRMTVEYELTSTFRACALQNVEVYLPLNGKEVASVTATIGTADVVPSMGAIQWSFDPTAGQGGMQSGSMEISLADGNAFCGDVLFPISVVFTAPQSLAQVGVSRVIEVDTEMPVRFHQAIQLLAEKYYVE